jgi:hypothetical protein
LVNPLQPLEATSVAARYGFRRTFLRELRARQNVAGKSELARGGRGEQGQQRGDHRTRGVRQSHRDQHGPSCGHRYADLDEATGIGGTQCAD